MPWKEPGEKPREPREPWGSGDRSGDRSGDKPGGDSGNPRGQPPGGGNPFDLDAQLQRLRRRLGPLGGGPAGLAALFVGAIVLWFALGSWTLIDARDAGVVLRFGSYQRTLGPGLHARLPQPFAQVLTVDVGRARTVSDQMRMMTRDEQVALVDFYVQYKVTDPRKFLFAVRAPEDAMRQATIAIVRARVGTETLQALMAKTDAALTTGIRTDLQRVLDASGSGIAVSEVGIQNVSAPQEVKDAFDDIGNARQDAQRAVNDAQAAAATSESAARAQVAQMQADADAYKTQIVARAQGEAARFDIILSAYHAAPDVTRRRLWLETMQDVLAASRTVIDGSNGHVTIQLPPPLAPVPDNGGDASPPPPSVPPDTTPDKKPQGGAP
ncbi:MAG: FtsH protease activity modulator HflK [Rhodanobacteraceae bacterium]